MKCASTLVVTAISTTLTTRLGTASRSRVATIGPSSIRRVRAAAGEAGFDGGVGHGAPQPIFGGQLCVSPARLRHHA